MAVAAPAGALRAAGLAESGRRLKNPRRGGDVHTNRKFLNLKIFGSENFGPKLFRTDPERSPNGSRTDPEWTPNDPKIEMHLNRNVLGGDCLIERVKRWLASCGEDCESRVGKLERPSAGRTRNLHVFLLFAFSRSIVLSERMKVNEAQEHRNDADRSRRHSAQNVRTASKKSTKNQWKIDENPCQIDQKSTKNRFSAVLGAQGRFGNASGGARGGLRTPK